MKFVAKIACICLYCCFFMACQPRVAPREVAPAPTPDTAPAVPPASGEGYAKRPVRSDVSPEAAAALPTTIATPGETDEVFAPAEKTADRSIKPAGWLVQSLSLAGQVWVDSVYDAMTQRERIGQLLMLRAHSDRGDAYENEIANQIARIQPGGLCFFQGTPERQAELCNQYQQIAKNPLLISMDAEFGLGMRLQESTLTYPRQMTLGAIQNNVLIYQYGREMARQCQRLGVHISFSPVADVNNNAANPVINDRSFGEDRYNVARKAVAYMQGLQDGGVVASAKHFPGHGDTDTDSHYALPVIPYDRRRIDSLELFPFKELLREGVGSFMVGHLNLPAIDARPQYPASLSHRVITDLLRNSMKFNGLIFTDGMEMRAVTDAFPAGMAAVEALKAGNDIVLLPADPDTAVAVIERALTSGSYDAIQFKESVKRVLGAKYRLGLTRTPKIDLANIRKEITTPAAVEMKRQLFANALTMVRDDARFLPEQVLNTASKRYATLSLGEPNGTVFQRYCSMYAPFDHFGCDKVLDSLGARRLLDTLAQYERVYVSHHKTRSRAKDNYGLSLSQIDLVEQLNRRTNISITLFGNPYSTRFFDNIPSVLVAYTEDPVAQELAAQAWFGGLDLSGKLAVTASAKSPYRQGIRYKNTDKPLVHGLPESVGMNSDTLALMDALVQELIGSGAAPGCQILVARKGTIVWHKAYGYYTYEQATPVGLETLYDLASITKVAATTLSAMRLAEQGKFDVTQPLSNYLPELRNTNKKNLKINDLLAHQAGLQAWIPFYSKTVDTDQIPIRQLYRSAQEPGFSVPVASKLWMKDRYKDTIWQNIFQSELRSTKEYKYSDLTMYLTARAISTITGQSLDTFAAQTFYQPMALSTLMYNPWQKGLTARCAPTEVDNYFRQETIQGYVHDMGAAMLGGVSGHAGLFSNANDLAKIFQMLLNGGHYAGRQYLRPETIQQWTSRHPGSTRRGLGFDMKELDPKATANMSSLAGVNTFGHAGFTGNVVWADPDEELIFIFLSNRTYPSMNNNKLINGDYRPRLQSIVYRALAE